ncbi:cyclic nucleotide-binding domain (cNMP-BD) family protein [Desulforapulum autotrophicum HRM2]|jgi:CRP-like cAMP-binding protein|uniref:Cyclic nucleotide-binding domain (cNMP-BD) family protein n=1 Tax=Desulforapulum autotrophicum (strain ATCC 43914 / DSM 3382 / VKM B-1955 / HRM2) TaxID=177437 RepID=C0QCG0_DESAH|nr:Crp/Fnr family transcriptional regulator [Desulforapulum autotrophicum]ACN17177.1 cyclic nucleotide-binding domain (cNMP-BD) family protein [Desulforapulum autotrophicum HRM2]
MNSSTDTSQNTSEFIANLSILRQAHLFSSLPQEALKLFAYLATRESYRQGEYVFRTGDDDGCSYYIMEGSADLVLDNKDKSSIVRNYPQDHFLGGLSMFSPLPRLFSLRAAKDLTVIVMTREKFSMVMEKFPELSLQMVKAIAKRINEVEGQSIEHYKKENADIKDFFGASLI